MRRRRWRTGHLPASAWLSLDARLVAARDDPDGRVPSPGGWTAPPGTRPAWDWTPPGGASPRPERFPRHVRVWFRTPFVDRYAYAWLWHRGGWDVLPPPDGAGGAAAT